jgi:tetratricopeptide (TPR) repeat protein
MISQIVSHFTSPSCSRAVTRKKARLGRIEVTNCPSVLNGLPLKLILDHLPERSIQALSCSSKEIAFRVVEVKNEVCLSDLKKFIDQIVLLLQAEYTELERGKPEGYESYLTTISVVVEELQVLVTTLNPPKLIELALLKKHLFEIKDRLIVILSLSSHETLDVLQAIIPPVYFEQLFQVVKKMKSASSLSSITNDALRNFHLINTGLYLTELQEPDKALPLVLSAQTHPSSSAILFEISKQYAACGRVKEACATALKITDKTIKEEAIQNCCYFLSKNGKFSEAIKFALKINSVVASHQVLENVISLMIQAGKIEEICLVVLGVKPLSSIYKDYLTYCVVDALCKKGKVEEARPFVSQLKMDQNKEFSCESLGKALVAASRIKEADGIIAGADRKIKDAVLLDISLLASRKLDFIEARSRALMIQDKSIQDSALMNLVTKMGRMEKFADARDVINLMADDWQKTQSLVDLCEVLSKHKKFEDALELVGRVDDEAFKGFAMANLVFSLCEAEKFFEAEELISEIENETSKASGIRHLIRYLAYAGRFEKAIEMIDLLDGHNYSSAIVDVCFRFVLADRLADANELLLRIPAVEIRFLGVKFLIDSLCEVQQFEKAIDLAHKETNQNHQFDFLRAISIAFCKIGEYNKALELIEPVENLEKKDIAFELLSEILSNRNQFHEAGLVALRIQDVGKRDRVLIIRNKALLKLRMGS